MVTVLDFEPNGNPFGSKSKRKQSPQSYPIQCGRKLEIEFFQCRVMIEGLKNELCRL